MTFIRYVISKPVPTLEKCLSRHYVLRTFSKSPKMEHYNIGKYTVKQYNRALKHGSEYWTMKVTNKRKIVTTEMRMLHGILGMTGPL